MAIRGLRELGFYGAPEPGSPVPDIGFTRGDCSIFRRYPRSVPWKAEYVDQADQLLFKSIRERLKLLAEWLAHEVAGDASYPPMKGQASQYQANGRSQDHIWCCIYPQQVVNKSYALQVALIISEHGAELCLCLGSGKSQLRYFQQRQSAESAWSRLQSRLRSVPPDVVEALERMRPSRAVLRTSWREPGESQFGSVQEWAAYAGGTTGAQASISVFLTVDELEDLGSQVGQVLWEMVQFAAPLFWHCYEDPRTGEARDDEPEQEPGVAVEHPQSPAAAPSAVFDADALEKLARAERGLELDSGVYRALVAAIKSGKHVILTGPPGTAKTTLAEVACQLADDAGWCSGYALTTATSDWTTVDTVGGLRPAREGASLEFRAGIVLEAVGDNRWVIIDELNRSNFDRAFGQLFTVLSGQPVVLPYEDRRTGHRIQLCPENAAVRNRGEGYERVLIPGSWRIVATMNVFDKSLLFEMSFALMRRFAFIEVPSPEPAVFVQLWGRELEGLPGEQAEMTGRTLTALLALRSVKDIGPAVFIDMARFAREYFSAGSETSAGELAFHLFYSYLLPQYEGIDQQQGEDLFRRVLEITGPEHRERLIGTLEEVLGITLQPEPDDSDGSYPGTAQPSVSPPGPR